MLLLIYIPSPAYCSHYFSFDTLLLRRFGCSIAPYILFSLFDTIRHIHRWVATYSCLPYGHASSEEYEIYDARLSSPSLFHMLLHWRLAWLRGVWEHMLYEILFFILRQCITCWAATKINILGCFVEDTWWLSSILPLLSLAKEAPRVEGRSAAEICQHARACFRPSLHPSSWEREWSFWESEREAYCFKKKNFFAKVYMILYFFDISCQRLLLVTMPLTYFLRASSVADSSRYRFLLLPPAASIIH